MNSSIFSGLTVHRATIVIIRVFSMPVGNVRDVAAETINLRICPANIGTL
jgi:hypothetical protein